MSDDKVLLTRLYEKTSAKGNRYFVGRLGACRVLMMLDRDTPEGGDPVWQVFVNAIEERAAPTDRGGNVSSVHLVDPAPVSQATQT